MSHDQDQYSVRTPQQLGALLQGYRKKRALTQEEAGAKVGIDQRVVSRIELAPARVSVGLLLKLLSALDLELVLRPRGAQEHRGDW